VGHYNEDNINKALKKGYYGKKFGKKTKSKARRTQK
jgi:hypothetical protein